MREEYKDNLKTYLELDTTYQKWIKGELMSTEISDFDYYCVKHCEDIADLLKENEKLLKLINEYEREHRTVFQMWLKEIEKIRQKEQD